MRLAVQPDVSKAKRKYALNYSTNRCAIPYQP